MAGGGGGSGGSCQRMGRGSAPSRRAKMRARARGAGPATLRRAASSAARRVCGGPTRGRRVPPIAHEGASGATKAPRGHAPRAMPARTQGAAASRRYAADLKNTSKARARGVGWGGGAGAPRARARARCARAAPAAPSRRAFHLSSARSAHLCTMRAVWRGGPPLPDPPRGARPRARALPPIPAAAV